jgi:hypothetical protein
MDPEKDFDEMFGRCNGNGNGNGNTNKNKNNNGQPSKNKEQTKRPIYVKKYTAKGTMSLHESVIIGQNRKFVYLDKNDKPKFVDKIERTDDILYPADTFDTQNPIPFIFESEQKFNECLERAKSETLDSLFLMVETINRKYVDVEDHYHVLLTADIIWTWLQDKFGYTHYIIIIGDNGSGKNSQLLAFKFLGYRVFYIVSATAPNYFTRMGNVEEGQITTAEDEAEDIARDKEKRNLIKNGYASGGSIPKIELEGGRKSDDWLVYCQKWFSMEELPTIKEMKGIIDRSFVLRFIAGNPQYNIKDVINSAGEPKFKPLYDELIDTRNVLFCWRLLHHDDVIPDIKLNVRNRSAELTKPLIRLFQNSPIALEKILDSLSTFMIERKEAKASSFESKLYDVIENLIEQDDNTILKNIDIKNSCKENMDGEDIADKPGTFWSPLEGIGKVTQTRITSTCKSRFKAKDKFVKIEGKTYRALTFDKKILERVKSNYEIPDKIQIEKPVTLVTGVTLYGRAPPAETANPEANTEMNIMDLLKNNNENSKNCTELKDDRAVKQGDNFPESVTSVTSVTEVEAATIANSESVTNTNQAKSLVKCPESECNYQVEPYYMKIHLENQHGRTQQLEIREAKQIEYQTIGTIWNKEIKGKLDISQFIKIKGVKLNDQLVYDADPAEGNITLVNNFLTGSLRMRGEGGGRYPHKYLEFINRVFDAASPGETIEVCSNRIPGLNKCGNCFTVDINPKYKPDLVADGQDLAAIQANSFNRWRCDPPYNEVTAKEMYRCKLPSLYKLLEAGGRVLKPGSLMFLLCSQNVQSGTIGKGNIKRIGFINISVVPNNETRVLNIYVKLEETI